MVQPVWPLHFCKGQPEYIANLGHDPVDDRRRHALRHPYQAHLERGDGDGDGLVEAAVATSRS